MYRSSMAKFVQTISPTPFSFFDADPIFQSDADGMVVFVKRTLGDDILPAEITSKMIWAAFERSTIEYGAIVNMFNIRSQLANMLGSPTGSVNATNKYQLQTLEFLHRQAEAYGGATGLGGSFDSTMCYLNIEIGRQDYNLYKELVTGTGSLAGVPYFQNLPTGSHTRLKVFEVFHFEPYAAQHFLLNSSNVTNFLANEFNYESFVNSTVFYVLPVFEDVMRRGMLDMASRVRRSNYSYEIQGSNLRIFPLPTSTTVPTKLWLRVTTNDNIYSPPYQDDTIYGVSGFSNAPFSNIQYNTINDVGKWWIREMALAICTEMLGRVRSKFKSVPIPDREVTLNGEELVTQGIDKQDKLREQLRDDLEKLTIPSLMEQEATKAENIQKMLMYTPIPLGKAIVVG
jgi:hypothetical protein